MFYELKAVKYWNPYGTYTPSFINPRCGYHYIATNNEFFIGFDILSFFYPLRF